MAKTMGIVLAAGQGKRMKSKLYKVLHPVCGKSMVAHVLDALDATQVERTVVVVGFGAEEVRKSIGERAEFVLQEQQLGTGHAVQQAESALAGELGETFVVCGDTPLIRPETLQDILRQHREQGAAATILTAKLQEPQGYGRILRGADGRVVGIVEQKDCTPEQAAIQEINTGTYCFDHQKLFAALKQVRNDNAQQEFYLTDVIGILREQGEVILAHCTADEAEAIGVNDRVALADAERLMKERINRKHLLNGVTMIDPQSTYIESDVVIGADTVLYPGTILKGHTVIGEDCVVGPNSELYNTVLADRVTVKQSVLDQASVGADSAVGPFAYLRPGSKVGEHCKVGDFVELKNAVLGDHSKVSHLSYIGDAVVGENVNFGCGAITVNYDGFNKHQTVVEDGAFVGSNVNLIAPVKISKGAYVVAGSTITSDVPEGALAIARERQSTKEGYADRLRSRLKGKK